MDQLISSPHAHNRSSVQRTMLLVCGALLPATLYGLYLFGWPAINLWLLCLASAVGSEALSLWLAGRSLNACKDGSALLTGWLIAMTLPPWAPWWIAVVGTLFAVMIGKHLYGGLGQNLFNPAMLARIGLLISFPVEMTTWVNVTPLGSANAPGFIDSLAITFGSAPLPDSMTGATVLGHIKTALTVNVGVPESMSQIFTPASAFIGTMRGSLGETSALLILGGGLFLMWKRVISWHIPVAMLGTVAVLATLFSLVHPEGFAPAQVHLLSGAMMLGAFFIATDMVTSPTSYVGQLIFGAGVGAVAFIIRSWGSFPEAVGFAVLFMNALTPIIDRYFRPRIYGYGFSGKPLKVSKE